MKLTPQSWTWHNLQPDAAWLANCPADVPVVWQASLTDELGAQSYLFSLLSAEERSCLARFHQREDQQRFLIGRGLLRLLVGAHLNTPAERVEFGCGPFGKPFVGSRAGSAPLHFNVSHSGELVLLAFHPVLEVGVDVEEVRPAADLATIARQIFTADEHRAWLQLVPASQPAALYQAWTRHEAGLKATGRGFTGKQDTSLQCRLDFFDLLLPDGYQGAAACLRPAT